MVGDSFGYRRIGGVAPEVKETVWTTAADGGTTIHVAYPNTLSNPDIDAGSAHFVFCDDVVVEPVDEVKPHILDLHEDEVYLAHTVHIKGRP